MITQQIIVASASFSGYLQPGTRSYYDLTINITPLSHTDLTNNFALSWYLYLFIFACTGLFLVLINFILYVYHWILKIYNDQDLHILVYIKAIYLPAFYGVCLEVLLEFIYLSIISVVFLNKFMTYYFFKSNCNAYD